MQKQNTQADHYTMTNRLKRRVGQPGGKVWSIYNRGPASVEVKGVRYLDKEVSNSFLHPNCIMTFESQPVVQVDVVEEKQSANFSVVTYF
jgi:hypothetical protein